ncbi:MAG: hypothetical protein HY744_03200 [Deltaproteobacteria bacterium]|nr:hypothetical protein [Deltaproteobacteria bacterium]
MSISAQADNDDLGKHVVQVPAWIGLTDQYSEGSFVWYEGPGQIYAPVFTAWANLEPDNKPNNNADCAMFTAGAWSDEECSTAHAYVCEYVYP